MKSLFVGNLPWTIKDEELKAEFEKHGKVLSARVITDKFSGRSRGFGFVDVEDADSAKIVSAMNGYSWGGRDITVNEARPKTERRSDDRDRF
ncbi:RNA-binding protein [candidate division WOR-1 bacterium RIFCSPLOWO2_02_FULL_46_20]|uniref:RNA-binding protein n=2 Tax=Saganbacteria TaxID=1703751 RepID=A0A1F4RDI4_UNCSA|nr:MAG: RNA-binding protein [candidate division WOR-1 bacterium RIFCSPHIGHO2_02_FULL_45_12]OGC06218.1 MAG: RNA-binding protein [candidate division WOR-1 bacterium RIFCSPLOWO2_02_FULL_46_20]OGC10022.1 MAG: RNA-binding protein [candidate division WOR-1 bacterium RIFCSPLOWO2_12_FULL_45_9]